MDKIVGKKATGDRKKRLSKRERRLQDSKVKDVGTLYLGPLASRIASRVVSTVLAKENIQTTQQKFADELQEQLDQEISKAILISTNLEDENQTDANNPQEPNAPNPSSNTETQENVD